MPFFFLQKIYIVIDFVHFLFFGCNWNEVKDELVRREFYAWWNKEDESSIYTHYCKEDERGWTKEEDGDFDLRIVTSEKGYKVMSSPSRFRILDVLFEC